MNSIKRMAIVLAMLSFLGAAAFAQALDHENGLVGRWLLPDFEGAEMAIFVFSERELSAYFDIEDYLDGFSEQIGIRFDSASIFFVDNGMEEKWVDYKIENNNTLILMNPEDHSDRYVGYRMQDNVTSLSGRFVNSNDVGFFESMDFIDGRNVRITGISMMGYRAPPFVAQYEISGSFLILHTPQGSMALNIISDTIIAGDTGLGFGDMTVFIRR